MKTTAPLKEFDEAMGIRVYEIRLEDQPALWFQREVFDKKLAYVLPLASMYLVADEETLMERAFIMARELQFGITRSTIHKLMDLLTKHIDDLTTKIPPAPRMTRNDVANKLDRSGIRSLKMNGQEMLN